MDTGNLIGVPGIIWEICQVQWGEYGGNRDQKAKTQVAFVVQHIQSTSSHMSAVLLHCWKGQQNGNNYRALSFPRSYSYGH